MAGRFIASFDIEDWFHAENIKPSLPTSDWSLLESRVERNTHELLDILAAARARSTFFVLGWIARRHPDLVRRMVAEGHEVASHTDTHRRLYDLSRCELVADLAQARDSLEQLTGQRVLGVRAPAFTITDEGASPPSRTAAYASGSTTTASPARSHARLPSSTTSAAAEP